MVLFPYFTNFSARHLPFIIFRSIGKLKNVRIKSLFKNTQSR